jgi:hypothetical protein
MSTELVIISIVCFTSILNLLSTIFLSNAIFKLITIKQTKNVRVENLEKGLLELPIVDNYDPRFRN